LHKLTERAALSIKIQYNLHKLTERAALIIKIYQFFFTKVEIMIKGDVYVEGDE